MKICGFFLVDPEQDPPTLLPMNNIAEPSGIGLRRFSFQITRLISYFLLAVLLAVTFSARAEDPEDKYLKIFNVIEKADQLNSSGKSTEALAKYRQAQTALENFQKTQPAWNPQMVAFRLEYVGQKISELAPTAPKTGNEDTNAAAPQDQADANVGGPPEVKLLEPGSEPRKVMRLHPKPGDKQSLTVTRSQSVEIKIGQMQTPVKLPPMTFTIETTVKEVAPEGDITYEFVVNDASVGEDAGVQPQVAAAMKMAASGVKGLTGTGRLASHGVNKTEISPPANPQLQQVANEVKESFDDAFAAFPEEAIGSGARWEVRETLKTQGMTMRGTTTYQLVSLEGERVTATGTGTASAANQKIESPAMQGVKVDLTKLAGTAKGEVNLDLGKLMPSACSFEVHFDASMAMDNGKQKQTMTMKMDQKMKLEAK